MCRGQRESGAVERGQGPPGAQAQGGGEVESLWTPMDLDLPPPCCVTVD